MRGWLDLTAAIVEQAVADLDLAISPCRAKRKPDWAFTPEHFREFFDTAEDLFRVCGFRLNPEAVRDRLNRKLKQLDELYAKEGSIRDSGKASGSGRKA
jgi:hypothetical protein